MRNISEIVGLMQYILRKERGVFLTIDEATQNLDAAQLDAFEDYFREYGVNQVVHDALRPFRVYYQFTSDASGFVTYPPEYMHVVGTAFTVSGSTVNQISFYNEDEFVNALNSQLRPISLSNPMARDTATGFSLYPQTTQTGFFTYLTRPVTPVYATIVSGRQILYDAANSVQLGFSDSYVNNIIARALRYSGVNMDEKGVYDFSTQYSQETSG